MSKGYNLKNLSIGGKNPIRVNCNIGINDPKKYLNEIDKIDYLFSDIDTKPDILMDLSLIENPMPLYEYIIENYNTPVGIVPVYNCFKQGFGIEKNMFLEYLEKVFIKGISFVTIHFCANTQLYECAKKLRKIPITSRGGGLTIVDQVINERKNNIFLLLIDDIIKLLLKYDVAVSIGTSFRPASIINALDEVHLKETKKQLKICKYLHKNGVKTIVENIGHINLNDIRKHSKILKKFNSPIMPLGPIPIDSGFSYDHIASAIGASVLGTYDSIHIINSITSKEHISSNINKDDMAIAVRTAKLVAYILNISKGYISNENEIKIYNERAKQQSCILNQNCECQRCSYACPLKIKI